MKLYGRNLGTVDVQELNIEEMITQYFPDNLEAQKALLWLEKKRQEIIEKTNNTSTSPLPTENNKVNLEPGTLIHNGSSNIESLTTISQLGLMPTEWFGVLESQGEGRFCTFIKRILSKEESISFVQYENQKNFNFPDDQLVLVFDNNNPIMHELLKLDYFEYQIVDRNTPEKIPELYSEEEIFMFKNLIAPLSKASRRFHLNPKLPFYFWHAIPGGIPSKLINGICINESLANDIEYIEQIQQLFPQATIFDNNMNVIRMPIYSEEQHNKSL